MRIYKSIIIIAFLVLGVLKTEAQRGLPLTRVKEIAAPGVSKEKLYRKAKSWLNSEDDVKLDRWNDNDFKMEATRTMIYENSLVLENIVLSPNAALRTKGKMNYVIKVTILEGKVRIEFTNFVHEAAYSRYGQISFGQILTNDKAPLGKCFEDTKWCNAVWNDMKSKIAKDCAILEADAQKKFD
jgi:hypothetical protein